MSYGRMEPAEERLEVVEAVDVGGVGWNAPPRLIESVRGIVGIPEPHE